MGEDELRRVGNVATILLKHIVETKAKLEFGNELEERQIHVATHTRFEHEREGLAAELALLRGDEVVHRGDTRDHVGTIIVEARSRNLEVDGHTDEARLHVLHLRTISTQLTEGDVARAKVERRKYTQRKVAIDAPLAKYAYGETKVGLVGLCHPLLLSAFGRGEVGERGHVAIAVETHGLIVSPYEESVVEPTFINERLILHTALLSSSRDYGGKEEG